MATKVLYLEYDTVCHEPENGWKLHSFQNHSGTKVEDYVGYAVAECVPGWPGKQPLPEPATDDLRAKLESGLAFWLSVYDHGGQVWSLMGEGNTIDRQWDHAYLAGILVWEWDEDDIGPKTYQDRRKDAQFYLDEYNDWCAGSCYGFVLEDLEGKLMSTTSSVWGYIGIDAVKDGMSEAINDELEDTDSIIVLGEADHILDDLKLKARILGKEQYRKEERYVLV